MANNASLLGENIKCNNLAHVISQQLYTRPLWAADILNWSLKYPNNASNFNFINIKRDSPLLSGFRFGPILSGALIKFILNFKTHLSEFL